MTASRCPQCLPCQPGPFSPPPPALVIGDKELGLVVVGPRVAHRDRALQHVVEVEVLVGEARPVDALPCREAPGGPQRAARRWSGAKDTMGLMMRAGGLLHGGLLENFPGRGASQLANRKGSWLACRGGSSELLGWTRLASKTSAKKAKSSRSEEKPNPPKIWSENPQTFKNTTWTCSTTFFLNLS